MDMIAAPEALRQLRAAQQSEANLREGLAKTRRELEQWRVVANDAVIVAKDMLAARNDWRTWAIFWWVATIVVFIGLITEAARCHHG